MRGGPLQGVRVLDLSRVLAGPYCSMLLGDLGAEVVKVERPEQGDDTRQWGPPFVSGQSAYFLCCNRNKQSIAVDLKSPGGRNLAERLAGRADVLLENFLPGTLERMGLGADRLMAANPRLIYASITGFGQDGPYRDLPGYDILIQGLAGVMSITGEADGPPVKVGVAICDITAGLFAANAIQAALIARARTGRGDRIDIALFDSTVAWLANVGSSYLATGKLPERHGNAHPNIVPYQVFDAADRPVIIAVGNDSQWQRFCRVLGADDLAADPRFATNPLRVQHRIELIPHLAARLSQRSADAWLKELAEAEVPSGPVNSLDRVFADPQLQSRNLLLAVPHPTAGEVRMVGSPCRMSGSAATPHDPPPLLGQHTDQVLSEWLQMSPTEIAALHGQHAIA